MFLLISQSYSVKNVFLAKLYISSNVFSSLVYPIQIFCLVWLPGMFLITVGDEKNMPNLYQAGLIFCAIQPIISTIMAMTKADVRKYTINLLTLSYLFDRDNSN